MARVESVEMAVAEAATAGEDLAVVVVAAMAGEDSAVAAMAERGAAAAELGTPGC